MLTCGFCYIMALVIFMENSLPKRKPPRLDHYDYRTTGAYFITICTQNRRCLLSRIVGRGLAPAEIRYTAYGRIAQEQLLLLEQRYPSLKIDQYVIMPNHIHVILLLEETAGDGQRPTIMDIVCAYKSLTTRQCKRVQPIDNSAHVSFLISAYYFLLNLVGYSTIYSVHSILLYCITSADFFMPSFS